MRKKIKDNPGIGLSFLYNTKIGRIILKPLVSTKTVSNISFFVLNSKISCLLIKPFIKKHDINMNDYELKKYKSFNDFFIRKIKPGKRKIIKKEDIFIAPCDSKLTVYEIDSKLTFKVKNSLYDVSSLIKDEKIAKKFKGGYALVYRLSPEDYHRYYFIDDGIVLKNYKIAGFFHTVNPVVYDKFKVFKENTRECTYIKTKNFSEVLYVEVGALLVGKINNHKLLNFKKGEEKGYFMYGGSTVIILVKKDVVKIDDEIINNSKNEYETYVKLGDKIGVKI